MRRNYGEIKARVSRLCDNVSDDGVTRAGESINDAQEYIQAERDWSFLGALEQTITMVASTAGYDTPDGMYSIQRVYYKGTDDTPVILMPCTDEDYLQYYDGRSAGDPTVYMLKDEGANYKSRIYLGVSPSTQHISVNGSTLYLEQYSQVTELTLDSQYPSFPYDFTKAIEYLAAALMCQSQGDTTQASGYMSTYQLLMNKLIYKDIARYPEQFSIRPQTGPNPWRGRRSRTDYGRRSY